MDVGFFRFLGLEILMTLHNIIKMYVNIQC